MGTHYNQKKNIEEENELKIECNVFHPKIKLYL